ncbi:MAG: hypothetical protein LAO23_07050 [Acidobacteriia bacterium]|jgi:hypothetical protein|nr:hypothetical protein [Terriglobia bacterium]
MMKHDEIDRILSREDEILPSSGFAVSVMDAVRREAAAPPPIPFPWKRAIPGLVAAGVVLVLVLVGGVVAVGRLEKATSPDLSLALASLSSSIFGLQRNLGSATIWTALALVASWVSVKLSMRLASGRG